VLSLGFDPSKSTGWCVYGPTEKGELAKFIDQVVMKHEDDDCLIWSYGRGGKGYAYMRAEGKHQPAHRYICKLAHGPAPSPLHEVAHSCGRGFDACVNKNHLSWKTPQENASDKSAHGTVNNGVRNGSAKLNEAQVLEIFQMKGRISQQLISEHFKVCRQTVGAIHSGKKWAWLTKAVQA
jgi:hypothetical protein